MSAFASLLREFFIAASLTQEVLAERCRVSRATIATFEQGGRQAPRLPAVALKLPARLGGPVTKLGEASCR